MLSIPTVTQMLSVIGVALLGVIVVVAAVTYLLDRLTGQTAQAITHNATATPARPASTLPGQRTAAHDAHRAPAGAR